MYGLGICQNIPTAYYIPSDVNKILAYAKQLKAQRDIAVEALEKCMTIREDLVDYVCREALTKIKETN